MRSSTKTIIFLLSIFITPFPVNPTPLEASSSVQAGLLPEARVMDDLLSKAFKPDLPGAAVIVTRKGETLLRKGYGMADLELKVPIEPDMVFRLGSITKQFTAVSVLMLQERGKLSIQDPITKFLPDYPTHGQQITVEHLLTHTSGIKSMTSMPERLPLLRKDLAVDEMIDFFKNQPMDFAPGKDWRYNNSGYYLLGAIIEKVSGESYEEFINRNIFEPLGMSHSYYDRPERILPRRVKGYQGGAQGLRNAPYISMTQPFSAGALASSVDDLALWHAGILSNQLLKKESLAKAQTPYRLEDGRSTGYGYGWWISDYEGHRTFEHGGSIFGFASYELSLPEDDIFCAVLTNGAASPRAAPQRLAVLLAALALGKPYEEPVPMILKPEQLDRYVGVYTIAGGGKRAIVREGNRLFFRSPKGMRAPIQPLSETVFSMPGTFNRLHFFVDAEGGVTRLEFRPRTGMDESANHTPD